jgi:exodeoxyribonuclease V alpha subunit
LGSGLIKGVGPVTAKRIVAHFALDTLEIIEQNGDRLIEVPGIGKKRVKMIQKAWVEQKAIKEVMLFLQSHGVSTTYAVKSSNNMGINRSPSSRIIPINYQKISLELVSLPPISSRVI